jgi:succinoglycan biosynthesis protein ExoM
MAPEVAICITTFRRPDGLKRLLQSIDQLTFTRGAPPGITVIVVDNDAAGPLEASHPDLRSWTRWPLDYRVEPRRGVSHARNAALRAAGKDVDFIAFVDDDEWVSAVWLEALLEMQRRVNCTVVQGPVLPVFENEPLPWMALGRFYEVGPFENGKPIAYGATGNCLIRKEAIDALGLTFDMRFNLSGGEDLEFFDRLSRAGHTIVAASEAIAYEWVPAARMRFGWVMRRGFRTGHSLGLISIARGSPRGYANRIAKSAGRLLKGLAELSILGIFDRVRAVRGAVNVAWAVGTLAAFAHVKVDHYGAPAVNSQGR